MIAGWLDFTPLQILREWLRWPSMVLFLGVVISAVAVAYVAHLNRQASHQLQTELMRKNSLQEQWGQLLLEHSTRTAHREVDRLAREQLQMGVPGKGRVIVVQP